MMQHSFKLGKFQLHHRKGKNPLAESEAVVLVAEAEESYCTFTDSSNMTYRLDTWNYCNC